jgi:hypothetical protein
VLTTLLEVTNISNRAQQVHNQPVKAGTRTSWESSPWGSTGRGT